MVQDLLLDHLTHRKTSLMAIHESSCNGQGGVNIAYSLLPNGIVVRERLHDNGVLYPLEELLAFWVCRRLNISCCAIVAECLCLWTKSNLCIPSLQDLPDANDRQELCLVLCGPVLFSIKTLFEGVD